MYKENLVFSSSDVQRRYFIFCVTFINTPDAKFKWLYFQQAVGFRECYISGEEYHALH